MQNSVGICGLEFLEYCSPHPEKLHDLFIQLGFSLTQKHRSKNIDLYQQNDIYFLLNREIKTFAERFQKKHGPSICSMGLRVKSNHQAKEIALSRGAESASGDHDLPALKGIGDSLIYLVNESSTEKVYQDLDFVAHPKPQLVVSKGFISIDHLTNNVYPGELNKWSNFYQQIFDFTQVRYFDIRGQQTGLLSFALRSPCGTFCIPINEGTEKKSQINEYLEEYDGPGIQHIAFMTHDIVKTLEKLKSTGVKTLDIDDQYYQEVFERVPNVTEDPQKLQQLQILVDGDRRGYILQIFTKNLIGPIFFEIIQRKNHLSFGEGNFGALFRSIEKDQQQRGYLK
jgi:4-hydroxyphenylpyruvate dioxygenase